MDASIIKQLSTLPDPRVERTKRYPLIEIILLIISATVSGCEGWKQIKVILFQTLCVIMASFAWCRSHIVVESPI